MFQGLTDLLRSDGGNPRPSYSVPRSRGKGLQYLPYILIAAAVAAFGHKLVTFMGPVPLIYMVGFASVLVIYAAISFRSLLVPFLVLIASVSLLRFLWAVHVPLLPDMFLDRVSLVWLLVIFFSMSIYLRKPLRGPFALDILMIMHATYIFIRVMATDPRNIALWVASLVTPYLVFFLAKNIVLTRRQIRIVLILLGILSFYYLATSIFEKFHIDALLYPTIMREPHPIAVGRSSGPFRGPGMFGDTMAMVLPVYLYFMSQARNRIYKIGLGLIFLLGAVGIYFTYTRGSWLCAILAIGMVVATGRKAYLRYVLPALFLVPVIGVTVIGVQQDKFLAERVGNKATAESRAGNLVTGLRLWRDYPLFGCGSYQFQEYSDIYIDPVELPIYGTVRVTQFRGSPAHDMYLGPLAEDGIVGMLLQLLIHAVILRVSVQKLKLREQGDHFATYILPLFFGIYTVYLFGGLIISFRHFAVIGSLYYMAAGITYGYRPEDAEEGTREAETV